MRVVEGVSSESFREGGRYPASRPSLIEPLCRVRNPAAEHECRAGLACGSADAAAISEELALNCAEAPYHEALR